MEQYDVIIIGGGLAGLTQAILLAQQGIKTACLDRERPVQQLTKGFDTRTTAISWGSRNVLQHAGVWPYLEDGRSCSIDDIRILDGESPHTLSFLSQEVEGRSFGWIVDNHDLRVALHDTAQNYKDVLAHKTGAAVVDISDTEDKGQKVVLLEGGETLSASLVTGCDGRQSFVRESQRIGTWGRDYGQTAIVCIVEHEKPNNHVAVEHFLPEGPFASLPMVDGEDGKHRSAVVWSIHGGDASEFLNCDEDIFNAHLERLYQGLFGQVKLASGRQGWPLNIKMAYRYTAHRVALAAEAAHGIHPIAGQGLNMSLRDCACLSEILGRVKNNGSTDFGDAQVLSEYQRLRRLDNTMMGLAMEGFNGLFSNHNPVLRTARRTGLRMISKLPFAKRFFMTQAMGTVGHVPSMVKEDHKNHA